MKCKSCKTDEYEDTHEGQCAKCIAVERDRLEGALFMALQMFGNKTSEQAREFINKLKANET